jgi:hypothetical protein
VVRVDNGQVLAVGMRVDRGGRFWNCGLADDKSKWPKGAVDGEILSRMGAESGWHSPTTDGKDVVFVQKNNRNSPGPHSAVRLSLDDAGRLVFKKLWETDGQFSQRNPTALYHAGLLYIPGSLRGKGNGNGIIVLDAATGKMLNFLKAAVGTSLVAADGYLIVTKGGHNKGGGKKRPDWNEARFTLFNLGANLSPAGSASLLSDERVPYGVRRYFPEYIDWHEGRGKHALHLSNPVMYGNKAFYRSMTHLYCIGKR